MDKYYTILDTAMNFIAPGSSMKDILNIPKVQLLLLQLMRKKRVSKTLRFLDIGSGVGTTTFALLDLITLLDNLCELYGEESFFDKVEIYSIEGSENNIVEKISIIKLKYKI